MAKELTLAQQQADRKERAKNLATSMSKDGLKITYAANLKDKGRQLFGYEPLDKLTNGGIKRGVFSTIWGDKCCGKTTFAYRMIAQAQREGKICAYVDMERGYDEYWALKQGVNIQDLLHVSCDTAEQAMDAIINYCSQKLVDLIVLDSIHGLAPHNVMYEKKTKTLKSSSNDHQAPLARKLSQWFPMVVPHISNADCAGLLIGQTRTALGGYVAIETLTGGRALKHNSRLIIHVWAGKGEDAPTKKEVTIVPKLNEEGDPILDKKGNSMMAKRTTEIKIGTSIAIKIDKSQTPGCVQDTMIRVPLYSETGLDKPIEETKIEPIIPNVNEVLKESIEIDKQLEEVLGLPTEPKKKRGRPATKGK